VAPQLAALAEQAAGARALIQRELEGVALAAADDGALVASRSAVGALPAWLRGEWLLHALDRLGAAPRRARISAARFARLVDDTRPFALHLSGARVLASTLELRVERWHPSARPRPAE
jgi:hypothetical protein